MIVVTRKEIRPNTSVEWEPVGQTPDTTVNLSEDGLTKTIIKTFDNVQNWKNHYINYNAVIFSRGSKNLSKGIITEIRTEVVGEL